jgi:hypothetical protein
MFRRGAEDPFAAEKQEFAFAIRKIMENENRYQQAIEPFYIDQLIYERAALISRCRLLLKELRAAEKEEKRSCPS